MTSQETSDAAIIAKLRQHHQKWDMNEGLRPSCDCACHKPDYACMGCCRTWPCPTIKIIDNLAT